MNTIGDMQNEKYFYDRYNVFEYNHDFVILLKYKYIYINLYTKYNYIFLKPIISPVSLSSDNS